MTGREEIGTVVIGAGQAGLALSRVLTAAGREHVVLERGRAGERWRSERWDSFTLLSPAWAIDLPGLAPLPDPDAFLDRAAVVDLLDGYAASFGAPVRVGTEVLRLEQTCGGWDVRTRTAQGRGVLHARDVVVATGHLDLPRVPAIAAALPDGVLGLPSARYRNPAALPPGGVLVVGAGPAGQQIAAELARAGRDVVLAAGRHQSLPRQHRGADAYRWMERLGRLRQRVDELPDPAATLRAPNAVLTGGRRDLDLRTLGRLGVRVAGRLLGIDGRRARFGGDLPRIVADADASHLRFRAQADGWLGVRRPLPEPTPWTDPGPGALDLRGVGTVVWATGYRRDRSWIRCAEPITDAAGEVLHRDGVTAAPGLSFLGLRWQRTRGSGALHGVGADAEALAGHLLGDLVPA